MRNPTKQIFILAYILALLFCSPQAFSATLKVCKTCSYTSVKQAVQKARPGDTIVVEGGTYQESGIEITKPVTILGQNNPVIDGNFKGQILTILSDNVTIQGLTLKNIATSYTRDDAAIRVIQRTNVRILNNIILNTYYGIYLQYAENIVVKGNQIKGENTGKTESALGNAIHAYYTDVVEISDNTVEGHRDGIYLETVKNSVVHRNISQNNQRYGLHFMFSNGNTYTYNVFKNNGAGVAVMYTDDVRMEYNTFEDNWGAAAYGLLLKDIRDSEIRYNTFRRNTAAIYMESSSRLDIQHNNFERNGWAIKLLTTSVDNVLKLNNFSGNSFDISTNGPSQLNQVKNNYWEKYTGYDLDKDGVGDVPYRPVSLFAMLVEQVPPSVMFMRSFMVDLLDNMEKVLPSIIPENLVDNEPLMKRIDHDNDKKLTQVIRKTKGAPGRER